MNGSSALLRWVLVSGQAWEESDRTKGRRAWPTPCTPALLPHGMGAAWKEQTQGKGPAWSAAPWRGGGGRQGSCLNTCLIINGRAIPGWTVLPPGE